MASVLLLLSARPARSQAYAFSTLAGVGCGSADGTNGAARFFYPKGGALDLSGNLYVADSGNHTIRKLTPGGLSTTLAGVAGVSGSADGLAASALFNNPSAVAVDASSNVYVADTGNHTIRIITPAGTVGTLAGLAGNYGGVDGTNSAARFNRPMGIALDSATNLYIADTYNHTIRKLQSNTIASAWVVSTLAGQAGTNGSNDGTNALLNFPAALTVDKNSNVYVADSGNFTIRTITPAGLVGTLAGLAGQSGSVDSTNSAARFVCPCGIALDSNGFLYVTDGGNSTIRKITPGGSVSTLAGQRGVTGNADGTNSGAQFNYPCGVAVDAPGANIYVADSGNNTIRQVTPAGTVTTLAGLASGSYGSVDGTNSTARLLAAQGVAVDGAGNVYATDTGNNTVRKITPAGVVTTLAGQPGVAGASNGVNNAALFWRPTGVALDAATNLYIADSGNHTIRVVTPAGVVSTLAGLAGNPGYYDGTNGTARFANPAGVAVDAAGNVYVADFGNAVIRKITPAGVVTTLAGMGLTLGSADGTNTAARFALPCAVAVDGATNVYVADTGNHTIRVITPAGMVSTLAGLALNPGSANGVSNAARFYYPHGLALDAASNVFVADTFNGAIRKITPAGTVRTVAGSAGSLGVADDSGPAAQFHYPYGIAVDSSSNLYVADAFNHSIRKGVPHLAPLLTSSLTNQAVLGGTSVTFSATVAGAGALSYQWESNGIAIVGATNATLVIKPATPLNAATYNLVVSNAFGSVTSQSATLTVLGPPNDMFTNPTVVTGSNFTVDGFERGRHEGKWRAGDRRQCGRQFGLVVVDGSRRRGRHARHQRQQLRHPARGIQGFLACRPYADCQQR